MKYGVARARHYAGPYERVGDEPIRWSDDPKVSCADAFVWREDGMYQMIFNDLSGHVTGEDHAGGPAHWMDGVSWQLAPAAKAYSRNVKWDDGSVVKPGTFERPRLLIQKGRPTHLICATEDGPGGFARGSKTWSTVIPLRKD